MRIVLLVLLSAACSHAKYSVSDHFDGKKFFNPNGALHKGFGDVLKWQLGRDEPEWPEQVENAPYRPPAEVPKDKVALTFVNHATYLIQMNGLNILTDPIFSERAGPLGFISPKRVRRPGIEFEQLPQIHVVTVSHNHFDHMDLSSLKRLSDKFKPAFLVPLGNADFLRRQGIENVVELDWWQEKNFGEEFRIAFTPCVHWSRRGLFDADKSLWGSWVFIGPKRRVYHAGDTGFSDHFQEIGEKYGPLDVALIPIGAYEPRWFMESSHINPSEAVKAHKALGAKISFPMHFGTFQLSDEAFGQPEEDLRKALTAEKVRAEDFPVLKNGETVVR